MSAGKLTCEITVDKICFKLVSEAGEQTYEIPAHRDVGEYVFAKIMRYLQVPYSPRFQAEHDQTDSLIRDVLDGSVEYDDTPTLIEGEEDPADWWKGESTGEDV